MKISEAPSGVKAKRKKKNAAQQQMEVNGEDLGAVAGQSSLQTGLTFAQQLCNEAPDSPHQGFLGIFSDFYKVISKVYFKKARPLRRPVI